MMREHLNFLQPFSGCVADLDFLQPVWRVMEEIKVSLHRNNSCRSACDAIISG